MTLNTLFQRANNSPEGAQGSANSKTPITDRHAGIAISHPHFAPIIADMAQLESQLAQHQEWGAKAREAMDRATRHIPNYYDTHKLLKDAIAAHPTDSTRPKDGPGDTEMMDWLDVLFESYDEWEAFVSASPETVDLRSAIRAAMQSQEKAPDSPSKLIATARGNGGGGGAFQIHPDLSGHPAAANLTEEGKK